MMSRASLVLAALWFLGGCSPSAVRLMPTPTLFAAGDPAPPAVVRQLATEKKP